MANGARALRRGPGGVWRDLRVSARGAGEVVDIKQQVKAFYDQVGWQEVGEGVYQNARYEDLRPVARDYIHRCHLRLLRHLKPAGRYLLDAGCGPIQYPEYLEYSQG